MEGGGAVREKGARMKVAEPKKRVLHRDQDKNQAISNGLKSAMVSRSSTKKDVCQATRASVQRYAELPSLRYGSSPTPTAIQMMGSGPLRLSLNLESGAALERSKLAGACGFVRRSKSFDGRACAGGGSRKPTGTGTRGSFHNPGEDALPAVRHVHFAELPPKLNRGIEERKGDEAGTGSGARGRTGQSCHGDGSVSSNARLERHCLAPSASFPPPTKPSAFRHGSGGAMHGGTVLPNPVANRQPPKGHDTARYCHGTLTQAAAAAATPSLPSLLRAARDGAEDALGEALRRAAQLGSTPEDLNAADSSGRTALSFIASNGDIKALEVILKFPGLDVNKPDNEGNTPLHFVAQAGQAETLCYMLSVCGGLQIDARNSSGFTPLMKAAIQGRTKCAKLLLCAGASPFMRDSGRGLKAEQWARFCGRYVCAEFIEKFSKSKCLERNGDCARWIYEPEVSGRWLGGKIPMPHQSGSSSSFKTKLIKAFRTTSSQGQDTCNKSLSVASQLTSAALCASSAALPSNRSASLAVKSLFRPTPVPKVLVTLAAPVGHDPFDNLSISSQSSKEKSTASRLRKKK